MINKWAKSRDIQITMIFKFLNFTAVFTQSKAHLSDGIDMHLSNSNIKFTFYLSTRFSAHEHRFLSKFNYLNFISVK